MLHLHLFLHSSHLPPLGEEMVGKGPQSLAIIRYQAVKLYNCTPCRFPRSSSCKGNINQRNVSKNFDIGLDADCVTYHIVALGNAHSQKLNYTTVYFYEINSSSRPSQLDKPGRFRIVLLPHTKERKKRELAS